jgi:cell wall-associated NlpC family hydrolase
MHPPHSSPRSRALSSIAAAGLALAVAAPATAQLSRVNLSLLKPLEVTTINAAPKPFAAFSASMESLRDSIVVSIVKTQIGTRYVHGGSSPASGFDCSGLVRYVMAALHVALPRTAAQQAQSGLALGRDTTGLRPGDLLTFGKGRRGGVSHIGIYIGHGRFVHASSVAGRVIESPIDRPPSPLIKVWRGSRRVVAGADARPNVNAATRGDS